MLLDCEEAIKLSEEIMEKRCVYIPYLGKNDHFADITNVCVKEVKEITSGKSMVSSLFPKENGTQQAGSDNFWDDDDVSFKYEEKLPHRLDSWTNNYILCSFIYTDAVILWENQKVYCLDGKNIMFY